MSMLCRIHSKVWAHDSPVSLLCYVERAVGRDEERDDCCHEVRDGVRNVLRNTIRLIRERRLIRENTEPFILTARTQHPEALA